MKERIILDLCGGTGSWSRPYQEAGYDVRVLDIKNGRDVTMAKYCEVKSAYGILAAPPCTEFSLAKHFHGKGKYVHNFRAGLEVVSACMRIVLTVNPVFWALENPNGYLKNWIGPPSYVFEPWEFGDMYQKKTCLWGKFNLPVKTVFEPPHGLKKFSMLQSREIHPEYYGVLSRQERRSITPEGFARAFFLANY